jgi:hypothetical protein
MLEKHGSHEAKIHLEDLFLPLVERMKSLEIEGD